MSRFLEPEPWLKAKIDPAALAQTAAVHDRQAGVLCHTRTRGLEQNDSLRRRLS